MSDFSIRLDMPVDDMQKIFGTRDAYIKKLERDFGVTVVVRDGNIIINGREEMVRKAEAVLRQLSVLSGRGDEIEEQSVNYAITMEMEDKGNVLAEMDSECICHTVNG